MSEQITPGAWRVAEANALGFFNTDGSSAILSDEKHVANVSCQTPFKRGNGCKAQCAERDANAHLIAEAGTVHHETGCTPRQLLEQRDNAWQELRKIREAISANPEEPTFDEVRQVVAQRDELLSFRATIAKVKVKP
jgi:hypothetical protein